MVRGFTALMGKRRSGVSAWGLRPENYLLPLDKSGWSRDHQGSFNYRGNSACSVTLRDISAVPALT